MSTRKPAACFELFSTPKAAIITAFLQILSMLFQVGIYFILENRGYFVNRQLFRMVIVPIATVYIGGAVAAIFGVFGRRRLLVTVHSTITITLMVLMEILAISIIVLMAIGKRNSFLNELPGHFVNERKFYDVLGPFWIYLGAICLHIIVAVNMAFLQPLNDFANFVQKESEMAKNVLQHSYSITTNTTTSTGMAPPISTKERDE